jgi:thiosulfate/3-mercaptopyruvate sulfurtransferase
MTEPEAEEPEPEVSTPSHELLVTTEWLAAHGQDTGVLIIDTREAVDYAGGHLPGAVNVARSATFDPLNSGDLGKPGTITELFGAAGIDESVHVVLYDEGRSTSAARVFWTLEQYGHATVSVLDGGLVKWQAEGRELTQDEPTITPTIFVAMPGDLTATMDHVLEGIDEDMTCALDTRSDREWESGRVPGAVHIEWTDNFTEGEVPVFKSVEELTALYEGAGLTKDHRIHSY